MQCPGCGLYHPPLYERCVSCGANLGSVQSPSNSPEDHMSPIAEPPVAPSARKGLSDQASRRSKTAELTHHSSLPTMVGIVVALLILLVSAGATFFFLSKPTDDQLLFQRGQHE